MLPAEFVWIMLPVMVLNRFHWSGSDGLPMMMPFVRLSSKRLFSIRL
jgi:hypothetical protein